MAQMTIIWCHSVDAGGPDSMKHLNTSRRVEDRMQWGTLSESFGSPTGPVTLQALAAASKNHSLQHADTGRNMALVPEKHLERVLAGDVQAKHLQSLLSGHTDLSVWIREHVHEAPQQQRQVGDHVDVRYRSQDRDPADQELALQGIGHGEAIP